LCHNHCWASGLAVSDWNRQCGHDEELRGCLESHADGRSGQDNLQGLFGKVSQKRSGSGADGCAYACQGFQQHGWS
jgi:hypothetical protein